MKNRTFSLPMSALLLVFIHLCSIQAQSLKQSLFPPNLTYAYRYGHSIKVDGNTMVVSDRGYKPSTPGATCGSIDDGAIHIYNRTGADQPWPTNPNQTIIAVTREGHFGDFVYLKGNSMIVTEERQTINGVTFKGCIKYYKRTDPNSNFVLTDTEVAPANVTYFPSAGVNCNGKYIAAVANSAEPNIHIYKINTNTIDFLYSVTGTTLAAGDNLTITDNDVLVLNPRNKTYVKIMKLTDAGFTNVNADSLNLYNPTGQTNNVYHGSLTTQNNELAIVAKGQVGTTTFYYIKVCNLASGAPKMVKTITIPGTFTSANGYAMTTNSIALKDKDALFLSFRKNSIPLTTLGFKYSEATGSYNYLGDINMIEYNLQAGALNYDDTNYDNGIAYDGSFIYIGDTFDKTNTAAVPVGCSEPRGSVRIVKLTQAISTNGNFVRFDNMAPDKSSTEFGRRVSIYGDYMVVGHQSDDDIPHNSDGIGRNNGAAFIYKKVNGQWKPLVKKLDEKGAPYTLMGSAIAINDKHLAVGVSRDPSTTATPGSVLTTTLFGSDMANATITNKVVPPDNQNNANFGSDVALYNNTLVVGAPEFGGSDDDGGSVYVYDYVGGAWTFTQKITASDRVALASEYFGTSVDIDGDKMIVGAIGKNNTGAVYFFKKSGSTWTQTAKFVPSEITGNADFGTQVVISQNYAIASDPLAFSNDGFVQFYKYNGTSWQKDLTVKGPAGLKRQMGCALAMEGTKAIVASSATNQLDRYDFQSSWTNTYSTFLPGKYGASPFSFDVDLNGDQVVIGKGSENAEGLDFGGAAYVTSYASITGTKQATPFSVSVTTVSEWNTGATMQVSLKNNTAAAITGWSVSLQWPNITIPQKWDCAYSEYSSYRYFSNLAYNQTIGAGATVTFGFNITKSGSLVIPTYANLNGVTVQINAPAARIGDEESMLSPSDASHTLFPNPLSGNSVFTNQLISDVFLFDAVGNNMGILPFQDGKITLPELAPGVYVVQFINSEGLCFREKIIKY